VILSVVPMVRVPPPPLLDDPLLLLLPPHAVSTRAVAATPAVATTRRRLLEPDLIRYLVFRRRLAGTRRCATAATGPMEETGLTRSFSSKKFGGSTVTAS
jgi:hypothetical protein